MSGCHPEIVSSDSCDHGQPLGLGCLPCSIQSFVMRLDELAKKCETEWKMFYSSAEGLSKRMAKLEEAYKADAQVAKDIIFEGARRNEELRRVASDCDSHCGAITCLERKVEALEKTNQQCFDANPIAKIYERFKELEKSILETRIQFIDQVGNEKKPHRCPICIGSTFCGEGMMCVPCDGTGIVWG